MRRRDDQHSGGGAGAHDEFGGQDGGGSIPALDAGQQGRDQGARGGGARLAHGRQGGMEVTGQLDVV